MLTMNLNLFCIAALCFLYNIEVNEGKKKWRICAGKYKQRRGPFGDNSMNQKSLYRYRDNNTNMANYLRDWKYIQWERVREVFLKVDRKDFVYDMPYQDIPKHLGYCSWISSPHTVAHILDLCYLNLHRGAKVLEIGSGSGYMATLMAHLVGPKGHVTGLEHMIDICIESIANISLNHIGLIENQTIDIIHKDGRNGHAEGGPYDCIIASCAYPEWPTHLEDQLANGGRLVVPVGREGELQNLTIMDKLLKGTKYWFVEEHCSFEPLMYADQQEKRFIANQHFATVSDQLSTTPLVLDQHWINSEALSDKSAYQRLKNSSDMQGSW
uniref:protein-L-isoaspartate(D-aspartate) O-methyltransferase n=1 Tax=Cacopsylla melanoneura TaxID=428564 RepID=A0A8D8QN22_9HEMI